MTEHRPTAERRLRRSDLLRVSAVLVLTAAAFGYGASVLVRPSPRPATAPAGQFSAVRAMQHDRVIANGPHPAGSPAMADVADYLQARLDAPGLDTHRIVAPDPRTGTTLRVVAGRVAGTHPTGAVLLVAHPDSVPWGPGGGDNATGASVLLETVRAISAGSPPRNDVIVLFDDGEELGGYPGGELFAQRDPWMREVKLVVGLDTAAWGVPAVIQDSPDNGELIRGYASGARTPTAFGFDASTNRGDDAEINPFTRRGVPGLEIEDTYANVGQHTAADTSTKVNLSTLQLMGDQVLGITHSYAAADLTRNRSADRAFFTLPHLGVVSYPAAWGVPILGLSAALIVAVVLILRRRRQATLGRLAAGFGSAAGLIIGSLAVAGVAVKVYATWYPDPSPHPLDEYLLPSSAPFALATLALITLGFCGAYWHVAGRLGALELAVGMLGVWCAFALLALAIAPVGAYLLEWPLLLTSAGFVVVIAARRPLQAVLVVPVAVAVVLWTPQLLLSYYGAGVAGLTGLAAGTLVLGLLMGALTPLTSTETATIPDEDVRRLASAARPVPL